MTKKMRIPMDMPNAVRECGIGEETSERNAKAKVDPRLVPLIDTLARKHPTWQFVFRGYGAGFSDSENGYLYYSCTIEQDGEQLGSLGAVSDWRTNETIFEMDCVKLRAGRQRSGTTKTKKIDKAVQLIDKNFIAKTRDERVIGAALSCTSLINDIATQSRYKLDRTFNSARPEIVEVITKALPTMTESQRKALEAIPEQGEYFMNATAMTRAVGSNHGAIVVMWRDVYNVGKNENGAMAVEVYDNTTLPSGIAMAVGMLKLVEPKQIIPDIGMRIADDSFYVMHPEGTP